MKAWSTVIVMFLALSARGQDLSKPITYRTVAIPLYQALDQISAQSGVKMYASAELENEPIILALKGTTAKDTMDHIAAVMGAKWTGRGKGEYMLERSPELAAQIKQEAVERRAALIKQSLDRLDKESEEPGRTPVELATALGKEFADNAKLAEQNSPNRRPISVFGEGTPAHRAMVRLLALVSVEAIAQSADGDSAVYSTEPNAMQRSFNGETAAVVSDLFAEHNAYADAFAKEHPEKFDVYGDTFNDRVAHLDQPPGKLLLVISRAFGMTQAEMIAVSPDGKAVDWAQDAIRPDSMSVIRAKAQAILASEAKDKDIPLSSESQAVSDVCKAAEKNIGNPPPWPALARQVLLDPVGHDPLSLVVSDGFLALADQQGTNLVAYPPDDLVDLDFAIAENGHFRIPSFLNSLEDTVDVQSADGWTTATPWDQVAALSTRTNRALYAKCLEEANQQGYISIDASARLAESAQSNAEPMVPDLLGLLDERYNPFWQRDRHLLRFYASLPSGQLAYMAGGAKLSFGELTKAQQDLFGQIAFHSYPTVEIQGPGIEEHSDMATYAYVREPTEFMPNGVPDDASVAMSVKTSDLLFSDKKSQDGWEWLGEDKVEEMAHWLALDQEKAGSSWYKILWLSPGKSRDITFTFGLTATRRRVGSLREVVRSDQRWTLDNLPPDLKKQLDEAVVKERAEMDKDSEQAPAAPAPAPPPRWLTGRSMVPRLRPTDI